MKNLLIALALFVTPVAAFAQQSPDVGGSSPEIHHTESHGESPTNQISQPVDFGTGRVYVETHGESPSNMRPETHGGTPRYTRLEGHGGTPSFDHNDQQAEPTLVYKAFQLSMFLLFAWILGFLLRSLIMIAFKDETGLKEDREFANSNVPRVGR